MSEMKIRGAKGGSKQHTPVESPDNLRSIAYFRILDLVSEGEIAGLVNGQQSIYLDETPLVNSDGSSNFPKAHIEQRTGTQDQTTIPGFDSVENEISVGTELRSSSPWVQSITDTTLSAIRITIGVPALSKANTSNGDINGYTISYKIEVSTDGGAYAAAYNGSFTGKTTSKYQRSHRIDLPDATSGWTLRVTRLTANADSASIADTTTIDSYTEIVDAKLRYPNSALIALMGDASQFSNIPNRAYDLFGRIIQVPSNYDVTTRTYSGTWDGTFKPSWTDNPAWIFYDLATHPRYGLGHLVDPALVDKWELYRIGQYCDGLVDDGMGGQEPRLTCNVYLQVQADAYKLLNDLSSAFRGISFWSNGTIVASADMPIDPVYTYTDANVIGGQFSYSASARKARFTTALVSWNDPNNFYRTKVEYVEDRDGIARYGVQQTAVTAVGCTSQGQAQRLGRWILLTSRLETDTVTFRVGLDGVLVAPGQIIRISDSARAGRRQGGRISEATTTTVTLDKVPTIATGDTITVGMPDGVSQTRTVESVSGSTVTVTTPFSATPVAQAVWTVESETLAAQTFRVLSVTEDKSDTELSFTITALQHNASKFDAVDFGTLIQVPPISALTITNQAGPSAVSLESAEVVDAVATAQLLTIAWTAVPTALAYEAEWRKDDGEWRSLGILTGLSVDIRGAGAGDYIARVRAKGTGNAYSLYSYSNPYTLGAASTLPTTVAGIQAEASDAAADAAAANAQLAEIASDNLLTPGEKPTLIRDYNVIVTEQAGIDAQAISYGITTEKAAYDGAVTALTTYLGTLTNAVDWDDISGNTTIVGTTFRSKFADVYTTRQALLNAIYAAAKAGVDGAQNAADVAGSGVPVYNPNFLNDLSGWTFDTAGAGEWYQGSGASTPSASVPTYLAHQGVTGQFTTCAHNTGGGIAVKEGQTVTALVALRNISANAGAKAYVRIGWYNAAGAAITNSTQGVTICTPDTGTGYFSQGVSRVYGTAPANAVRAIVEIEFDNHTSGAFTATSAWIASGQLSLDEVPDSSTYLRSLARAQGLVENGDFETGDASLMPPPGWVPNGLYISAAGYETVSPYSGSRSFVFVGNQYAGYSSARTYQVTPGDYYAVGGACSGYGGAAVFGLYFYDASNSLVGSITISSPTSGYGYSTATGKVPATAVYAKLGMSNYAAGATSTGFDALFMARCSSYDNALAIAGSGAKIGNQFNNPNSLTLNYGAVRSTTALTGTSAGAVSVSAFDYYAGSASVHYNAVSNAVTGLSQGSTYFIYCRDAVPTGGTKTWLATTNVNALLQTYDDIVVAGQVTIPTSGSSGGGGGGLCVCDDMLVAEDRRAGDAEEGDLFDCMDLPRRGLDKFQRALQSVERSAVECVRLTTEHGAIWEGSASTPFDLIEGGVEWAPRMKGRQVVTDFGMEAVVRVEHIGVRPVSHLHFGGCSYAAGRDARHRVYSHNLQWKP